MVSKSPEFFITLLSVSEFCLVKAEVIVDVTHFLFEVKDWCGSGKVQLEKINETYAAPRGRMMFNIPVDNCWIFAGGSRKKGNVWDRHELSANKTVCDFVENEKYFIPWIRHQIVNGPYKCPIPMVPFVVKGLEIPSKTFKTWVRMIPRRVREVKLDFVFTCNGQVCGDGYGIFAAGYSEDFDKI